MRMVFIAFWSTLLLIVTAQIPTALAAEAEAPDPFGVAGFAERKTLALPAPAAPPVLSKTALAEIAWNENEISTRKSEIVELKHLMARNEVSIEDLKSHRVYLTKKCGEIDVQMKDVAERIKLISARADEVRILENEKFNLMLDIDACNSKIKEIEDKNATMLNSALLKQAQIENMRRTITNLNKR